VTVPADGNGAFTAAMGMLVDKSELGSASARGAIPMLGKEADSW
jgi:peroxiredoxin